LAAGLVVLGWAYWPTLQYLWFIWCNEPNYSHGFLVIPVAVWIFWQRLTEAPAGWWEGRGPWWSWLLLFGVLAARAYAYEQSNLWGESVTIVPAVACLMLTLGGWPLLSVGWPAAVFLIFMCRLPEALNSTLSLPLQRMATLGSAFLLQVLGVLALPEGNTIYLPNAPEGSRVLEVAQACNGLSMLMTLAATVVATIFLFPMANWKRIVILASAIPVALVSNIIRILATGWCYNRMSSELAKKLVHDWSGLMMMPLALVLVGIELLILAWLAADSGATNQGKDRTLLAVFPKAAGEKDKKSRIDDD
jgi:exosortase